MENGKEEGKGKVVYSNGAYHEGDWKNGGVEGKGKLVRPDGGYYDGDFKNGIAEGKGKEVYPDGAYYDGDWKNGIREGKGKWYCLINEQVIEIQEGFYKNGKPEGIFLVTRNDRAPFYIEFKEGIQIK